MAVLGGWRLTRTGLFFIIGILVLGGLVTGGIFLVKNHGEAVRRDQAVKVAEQNLKDQSQVATQPVNTATSSDASSDAAKTNSTSTDTGTSSATSTATTAGANVTKLPATGIDDFKTLGNTIIVAIFTFSVASYVASRRASSRL